MKYAENVDIAESPSYEMSTYVHKVAQLLGISTLPGHIELEFVKDLGNFAGLVDGDEDQVDISIAEFFEGDRVSEKQMKINIAHEMIHAVQILTGRLIHTGLTLHEGVMSYQWMFDGAEYKNLNYVDQPWENEAYDNEEEIYNAVESGRQVCAEIQSRLYPRRP